MLVGLHGQKRSGKDTVAYRLQQLFPYYKWEVLSFANKLKEFASSSLGVTVEELELLKSLEEDARLTVTTKTTRSPRGSSVPVVDISIRKFLQLVGTEGGQHVFGENFWVDLVLPDTEASFHQDRHLVITDCRFTHEAKRILDLAGEVWYVDSGTRSNDPHASEALLPQHFISRVIDNHARDDNFQSLDRQLIEIFREDAVEH